MTGTRRRWLGKTAYVVTYAAVGAFCVSLVLAVASALSGAGASGVKFGQFVLGWFLFVYAALKLRPTAAWKRDPESEQATSARVEQATEPVEEDERSDEEKAAAAASVLNPFTSTDGRIGANRSGPDDFGEERGGAFARYVARIPPAALFSLQPDDRPGTGVTVGATALCLLAVSFLLEVAFGV
ncbi:hypothetical protein [Salarchaeum sp. JOR-1]|uniref:DUF7555 family protein n=1 Tax=Salarchaeum sp. JOR-1 TaxID=2599399 RepID=UPI001198377C|nr:hypothetical protein [Salarchaeum sp. JOR-1]QDX40220.1 hypothetical protein FQU85_04660 [Salarchaeum sp. JOR-1]